MYQKVMHVQLLFLVFESIAFFDILIAVAVVVAKVLYRPFSLGGHVESQENKKLCFCTASLTLNSRLGEANRAKTKLFILLRLKMAAEWERSIFKYVVRLRISVDNVW